VLAARAETLLFAVSELKLKSFCLRLADRQLPDAEWVEALGSLLSTKPPTKWVDADEETYYQELEYLTGRFMRVESMVFSSNPAARPNSAVRVALTQPSGAEVDRVIHISEADEADVEHVESAIAVLLHRYGSIGLAGASRALWKVLANPEPAAE
jgi:hypothetical protein